MDYEYAKRPYRIVGEDDVEVALSRFNELKDAIETASKMNDLKENWDPEQTHCVPPYRVQRMTWVEIVPVGKITNGPWEVT